MSNSRQASVVSIELHQSHRFFSADIFADSDVRALLSEVTDLRRKQLTLECGILDNEAKMNRKRKLTERKHLLDENGNDDDDISAAVTTIGERTELMKVHWMSVSYRR